MKRFGPFFVGLLVFFQSQSQVKTFLTSGMDLMVSMASFADTLYTTQDPRVTWWFNFSEYYQVHFGKNVGMFIGFGTRNLGLIANYTDTSFTKRKFRVYTISIPLGLKIGNLENETPFYVTFGGALDVPIHYKEKWFNGNKKIDKISEWFSNRVELFMPSAFVGFTLKRYTIRLHYYPLPFLNQDFSYVRQGVKYYPFKHVTQSNIFKVEVGVALNRLKNKNNETK